MLEIAGLSAHRRALQHAAAHIYDTIGAPACVRQRLACVGGVGRNKSGLHLDGTACMSCGGGGMHACLPPPGGGGGGGGRLHYCYASHALTCKQSGCCSDDDELSAQSMIFIRKSMSPTSRHSNKLT